MKNKICLALLAFFLTPPGFASQIAPINPEEFVQQSEFIVVASVEEVQSRDYQDHVTIHVNSVLRGTWKEKTYHLTLSPRGLTGFDPELKKGDVGVFFMKRDTETGKVVLAYWGGVALFTRNYFQRSTGQ